MVYISYLWLQVQRKTFKAVTMYEEKKNTDSDKPKLNIFFFFSEEHRKEIDESFGCVNFILRSSLFAAMVDGCLHVYTSSLHRLQRLIFHFQRNHSIWMFSLCIFIIWT